MQAQTFAVSEGGQMRCARCQGPTVYEVFVDWGSGGGHLSFPGWRCLTCGDISDSVILSHRSARPQPLSRHTRHGTGPIMHRGHR